MPGRPARLIYIPANQDNMPKLVESRSLPNDVRYMTLSHCWGFQEIHCLPRNNYASFLCGLDEKVLPHTFRDAIQVTRTMGFHFI